MRVAVCVVILASMPDPLTRAVLAALDAAPCSLRALAREADLSHTVLVHIRAGKRAVTPALARRVAKALRTWATACQQSSDRITRAVSTRGKP